ncbi:MBL fold metallo-hydrolase [Metabacillus herbersteinensis]|uniref:MBL fold metallo-hydrolase n=1 Tax=Metabacillus herbersteinensis TaxID=283816 RepID=A0ABV6GMB7_9BACI
MKITIVGYWGGFPGVNEATSGYLLQSGSFNLLLDCGSAVLSQLQNYLPADQLNAVILSHYHHDHVADVGPLQFARLISSYLHADHTVLPIYGHQFDIEAFNKLTYKEVTEGCSYSPEKTLNIGPFTISFLKTLHPVDCFAMRITDKKSTVVFTADSAFQQSFIPFTLGADLLLSECNLYGNQDGEKSGHMTSYQAAKIAEETGVKELILTHLPHFGDHQDLVKEAQTIYKGKITLAHTGYVWKKS